MIQAFHKGVYCFETKEGDRYILPYHHPLEYYRKDKKENYPVIFDEQFANFFALYMKGRKDILEVLKTFYGDTWYQMMLNTMLEIEYTLQHKKEEKHLR